MIDRLNIKIIFLMIGLLLLRPSVWGGDYSLFGLAIICIFAFDVLLKNQFNGFGSHVGFLVSVSCIILWAYILCVSILLGDVDFVLLYKTSVLSVLSVVSFSVVIGSEFYYRNIFYRFAQLNSIVGFSIFITWLLLFMAPYSSLLYWKFSVWNYDFSDTSGDVLFPITFVYGYLTEYNVYKFSGLMRESGLAPAVFCWSFMYFLASGRGRGWAIGCIFGLFLCGSSIGYLIFGVSLFLYYFGRKENVAAHNIVLILVVVVSIGLTLYAPGVGLLDKQSTHAASGEDRSNSIIYGLYLNDNIIFGHGLYYLFPPVDQIGITAIGMIYFFGIFGFILYCAQYFVAPFFLAIDRRKYFASVAPIFLTAIFFQPVLDSPLFVFLLCYIPRFDGNFEYDKRLV